ncbi:unnamed protein product [Rhizopus stolonifer]
MSDIVIPGGSSEFVGFLKNEKIGLVLHSATYLPKYQDTLKTLVHDGFELVGYARKSPTDDVIANVTRLVQLMVENLKECSFVSKSYVSFEKHDTKPNTKQ